MSDKICLSLRRVWFNFHFIPRRTYHMQESWQRFKMTKDPGRECCKMFSPAKEFYLIFTPSKIEASVEMKAYEAEFNNQSKLNLLLSHFFNCTKKLGLTNIYQPLSSEFKQSNFTRSKNPFLQCNHSPIHIVKW